MEYSYNKIPGSRQGTVQDSTRVRFLGHYKRNNQILTRSALLLGTTYTYIGGDEKKSILLHYLGESPHSGEEKNQRVRVRQLTIPVWIQAGWSPRVMVGCPRCREVAETFSKYLPAAPIVRPLHQPLDQRIHTVSKISVGTRLGGINVNVN